MSAIRYLLFAVVGVVVAVALFYVLSVANVATEESRTTWLEHWILRATCNRYELSGSVTDPQGTPIPFALIEALYLDQRLTTRTTTDGRFQLAGNRKTCEEQPEVVSIF